MTLPASIARVLPLLAAGFRVVGLKTWTGRDGQGFQFSLAFSGTKVALVSQEGHGGETRIEWLGLTWKGNPIGPLPGDTKAATAKREAVGKVAKVALDKLAEVVAATPGDTTYPGEPLVVDAEWLMDDLVTYMDLAKKCKAKTLFVMPGEEESGSYHCYTAPYDARLKAVVEKKYPTATIMNEVIAPYV